MKKEIFTNNTEILTDEQLDNISGGTWDEYRDLLGIKDKDPAGKKYKAHSDDEDNVVAYLRSELGIEANLNGSFWTMINPFKSDVPATYTDIKTGKRLAHSQVCRRARIHAGLDK